MFIQTKTRPQFQINNGLTASEAVKISNLGAGSVLGVYEAASSRLAVMFI